MKAKKTFLSVSHLQVENEGYGAATVLGISIIRHSAELQRLTVINETNRNILFELVGRMKECPSAARPSAATHEDK
ncbi:hypothetical protein ACVWWI_006583 [Bradyrhizobium sp. USDA 3686]|uniref:hypothetical protein n=1 Tax=Bradyrhizobium canariense TaxID=255045 RepID=UPI00195C35CA|nr:hypothetical protein [Bradyrhizobium canariense]MBM7487866.1 hypothetical protein [Bradyrhizobium canariense]